MQWENDGENRLDSEIATPVEMLSALFRAMEWPYQQTGEDELVCEAKGSWTSYQLRAIMRAEDNVVQLLALPEIKATPEKYPAIFEALGLINEQVWLGHFEMWPDSGILLYRHGLLLSEHNMLSLSQAQILVEAALTECDRFYPVFQFILWGDKSPREAMAAGLVDICGEA